MKIMQKWRKKLDLLKNFLYNNHTVNLYNNILSVILTSCGVMFDVIFIESGGAKDETYLATK